MAHSKLFQTSTHAKCILAGEHAVLRGSPAIIFPIHSKTLNLTYREDQLITADFDAPYGENLLALFWGMLEISAQLLSIPLHQINGKFFLKNNIPMGSGMGFSSVLCVTLTKWLIWKNYLLKKQLFNFAKSLEDHFHGKSSGVDIAGVLADTGIIYKQNNSPKPFLPNWQPLIYISSSNSSSSTAQCIKQVEEIWQKNPSSAQKIDEHMQESVNLIEQALGMNKTSGLPVLAKALEKACACFDRWNLITPKLREHLYFLQQKGAIAVKPTGSGAGGYVLSLWEKEPDLPIEMIKIF